MPGVLVQPQPFGKVYEGRRRPGTPIFRVIPLNCLGARGERKKPLSDWVSGALDQARRRSETSSAAALRTAQAEARVMPNVITRQGVAM